MRKYQRANINPTTNKHGDRLLSQRIAMSIICGNQNPRTRIVYFTLAVLLGKRYDPAYDGTLAPAMRANTTAAAKILLMTVFLFGLWNSFNRTNDGVIVTVRLQT